ncbi:MAG: histidine phosphatase family protein [Bacteroidales bacterium]|nr:histidine phosphatase family protein [Bacteroidales bacterium]
MKKLIFIRHGRAEDSASEISDFERSLTIKGKIISRQMARRFREKEDDPGLMITSPAFRALETAYIFASEFGIKPEKIMVDSNLYNKASLNSLVKTLSTVNDDINTITLFGHNPAFTEMPDRLSKYGCEFLTKTSVVCISFGTKTWSDIKPDTGKMEYFLKPEK